MPDNLQPGSFRVWDTLGHCYEADAHGICFLDESGILWSMSPGCERMASWNGVNCVNMTRMDMTRYQMERWTGLRDKQTEDPPYSKDENDGVPIYENDLILQYGKIYAINLQPLPVAWLLIEGDPVMWQCANVHPLFVAGGVIVGTTHNIPATLAQAAERAREGR